MKTREEKVRELASDILARSRVAALKRLAEQTADAIDRHDDKLRDELRSLIDTDEEKRRFLGR
jgi:hypothetical protein